MSPAHAYEVICSEVEQAFDYDVVKAFTGCLELYPIGSVLELSDRSVGIVIENEDAMRPVLRMYPSGDIIDLGALKHLTLSITRVVDPNEATV